MTYGGPYLGILACREEFVRKMPGRLVGQTVDRNGKRCWVLTLQTREQHIRREKATSNICTNQGLFALRATVYLAALGPQGLQGDGRALCCARPTTPPSSSRSVAGVRLRFDRPFFKEFTLQVPRRRAGAAARGCCRPAITPVCRWAAGIRHSDDCVSVAVTEKRTRAEIDGLAAARADAKPVAARRLGIASSDPSRRSMHGQELNRPNCCSRLSHPGRRTHRLPACDVPAGRPADLLPAAALAAAPPPLPEVGEIDLVRHFVNLSTRNMSIDTNFYPLGSCTMKYNPKRHERLAALPGMADLHPLQTDESLPGHARNCSGRCRTSWPRSPACDAVSLQPAAGAQGELTALLVAAAYFRDRGEKRTRVLIPDSAHGTNPASAAIAGFDAVTIKSNARGLVDLDDLQGQARRPHRRVHDHQPEHARPVRRPDRRPSPSCCTSTGALVYLDGANMNAILGITRPGDFGVDMMHYNVHKTFTGPHGAGGPGAGPIAVRKHLAPFLPAPLVAKKGDQIVSAEIHWPTLVVGLGLARRDSRAAVRRSRGSGGTRAGGRRPRRIGAVRPGRSWCCARRSRASRLAEPGASRLGSRQDPPVDDRHRLGRAAADRVLPDGR